MGTTISEKDLKTPKKELHENTITTEEFLNLMQDNKDKYQKMVTYNQRLKLNQQLQTIWNYKYGTSK